MKRWNGMRWKEKASGPGLCHELDHLDGVMYVDLVEGDLYEVGAADDEDEE